MSCWEMARHVSWSQTPIKSKHGHCFYAEYLVGNKKWVSCETGTENVTCAQLVENRVLPWALLLSAVLLPYIQWVSPNSDRKLGLAFNRKPEILILSSETRSLPCILVQQYGTILQSLWTIWNQRKNASFLLQLKFLPLCVHFLYQGMSAEEISLFKFSAYVCSIYEYIICRHLQFGAENKLHYQLLQYTSSIGRTPRN
jgi:hypothetical protein